MKFDKIKELIELINKNGISEFKYEDEFAKFSIRTQGYSSNKEVIVQAPIQTTAMPTATTVAATPVATPTPVAKVEKEEVKETAKNYLEIKSPMVGTFYRSASPEKGPFVKVGDSIAVDSPVCLIEAMKLFNEVKSEISGKIVKVMLEDASPVEYGQVLFLVEPA